MQGQRSSVESLPEAFEFDRGSSSSNSVMDQQNYWNNMVLNPVEARNIPDCLLPQNDTNISYSNLAAQGATNLSIWHSGESSSSQQAFDHGNQDGAKREHMWSSSLTIDAGRGPRVEGRQFEAASTLSLERVNINLNSNHVVDGQSLLQYPNSNISAQSADAGLTNMIDPALDTVACPHSYNPDLLQSSQFSLPGGSSSLYGSSSGCAGFIPEDGDGRIGGSLDGRRVPCKRKNIEGFSGQSSTSGTAGCLHQNENSLQHSASSSYHATFNMNISGSSGDIAGSNPSEVQLTERFGSITRATVSDTNPSLTVAGIADSSQRNFRLRVNPTHQHGISASSIWAPINNTRHSSVWSSHQPSSQPGIFNPSLESRPIFGDSSSQVQHQVQLSHQFPPPVHSTPWSGASTSRAGSLQSSGNAGNRLNASREEINSRSMASNNRSEHSFFVSPATIRQMTEEQAHWTASIPGTVAPIVRAVNNSRSHPSVGPTLVPHHNAPHQRLADVARRSLFQASGPELVGSSSNVPIPPPGHAVTSQEITHHSVNRYRGNHQSLLRSAFLADRHNDGVLGVPLPMRSLAAVREGRNRMISEIRNALDLMRRGENLRLEDVLILDQSVFYGGADVHDRHRDMRLDVDNMSYEELLALEERIGNVSTGLSEEKISKCLTQRVYLSIAPAASSEVEPCCVCQEEYVEGDNLGTLDCGHDFHTACIKQWLMQKNLCPICRTTGLIT